MKKTVRIVMIMMLTLFVLAPCAAGEGENPGEEIIRGASEAVEQNGFSQFNFGETAQKVADGSMEFSLSGILNKVADLFFGEMETHIATLVKILVIAVLAGMLTNLQGSFDREGISDVSFAACFIVIAGLSVTVFSDIMQIANQTTDSLAIFMQTLVPALSATMVSGGSAAGTAMSPVLFASIQIITYISKTFFMPLLMVITVLSVIDGVTGRFHITKLIDFAKRALKWCSGILLTIFVGVLGLQGFSTAFADGVAGKTVKYAVSNFVPLVGGVLSDSVEAVVTSMTVIKNAVGITGILALLAICAGPLLKILTLSFLYRFAAGITQPATDKRIVSLLSDVGDSIMQAFVLLLMICVMFIISVAMLCLITNIPAMMR